MEDLHIIELYWQRNESAIKESQMKYGGYCSTIANNILHSSEDTEECVNDTWFRAWNTMPPEKPNRLAVFLGRITRNLAIDNINIYYLDGTEMKSVSEFLPCAPKYIFESWKSYNHIGSEVQLINVNCDNNGTEGSDSSVAYYQAGDYFTLNITVSANLKDYYDTMPEIKLLESLKLTMTSYLNIEIDEYNLILE